MQCVYCVIWLVSGMENLWSARVTRLLLLHPEKGAERGLRLGFLSGRPRFAALTAVRGQVLPRGARAEPPVPAGLRPLGSSQQKKRLGTGLEDSWASELGE